MANKNVDKAKQDRIQDLVKALKNKAGKGPGLETYLPQTAFETGSSNDDKLRVLAQVALFGTHRWYIGRIDLPAETKFDWDGARCRDHWFEFDGVLSHPDLEAILGDVQDCMSVAVAAAIAAGLSVGGLVAITAAFKSALYACLSAKGISWADQITVYVETTEKRGDWHWCL